MAGRSSGGRRLAASAGSHERSTKVNVEANKIRVFGEAVVRTKAHSAAGPGRHVRVEGEKSARRVPPRALGARSHRESREKESSKRREGTHDPMSYDFSRG